VTKLGLTLILLTSTKGALLPVLANNRWDLIRLLKVKNSSVCVCVCVCVRACAGGCDRARARRFDKEPTLHGSINNALSNFFLGKSGATCNTPH